MLADSQQLIVFHVFTRSWASVCVSYFFVPVETGAPPFFKRNYILYIGIWRGIVKRRCRLRYNFLFSGGISVSMELKTHGLDRVLEALSPVLAGELDRIITETRQALEEDFQRRLESAVREAEEDTKALAGAQLVEAVADAKEATQKRISEELEEGFNAKLADMVAQIKAEASDERTRLQEQLHRVQEQLDNWRTFAEGQRQLVEASSQAEILTRFLRLAQPFAASLALYVTKRDGLALWKSRGDAVFPEIISEKTTDPESYFRTISVRSKPVAAVCALSPFRAEALDFLTSSLHHAIEVFALKLKAPLPNPAVASRDHDAIPGAAASNEALRIHSEEPTDAKAHAEARRTARLLVSEIKLYHEQELKEGRKHADIYSRLQKEIDLGRQTYTKRVPAPVLGAHDYFHEELIRILTENDPSRMGAAYPGPMNS